MKKVELEQALKQRVIEVVKLEYKTSVNKFAAAIGLRQTTLNEQINGSAKISASTILALLAVHTNISAEWLLRGNGNMYIMKQDEHEEICRAQLSDPNDAIIKNLLEQLSVKDMQIAEKDKQLAAALSENTKLIDLAKVKVVRSKFNDIKL